MFNTACVYWIRDKSHTDITREGYVGVSKEFEKRIKTHLKRIETKEHGNYKLIENFSNKIIIDAVVISNEDNCYDLEFKLRPSNNIGWNINAGGFKPPSQQGVIRAKKYGKTWAPMQGKKHSEDTKLKMSIASKGKPKSEEHIAKMKLRKFSDELKQKLSLIKKGKPGNSSTCRGMKWWNNGVITIMSKESPGENFNPGRIFHKNNKGN